ncbi:hypothetical protein TNCV_4777781 [Trichonephila clavipes]|nr:hypothetical protein TNCV_4777781 [Trichonephila clavipes]
MYEKSEQEGGKSMINMLRSTPLHSRNEQVSQEKPRAPEVCYTLREIACLNSHHSLQVHVKQLASIFALEAMKRTSGGMATSTNKTAAFGVRLIHQVYVETPLHPEKLTVWCALWAGGILLQKR